MLISRSMDAMSDLVADLIAEIDARVILSAWQKRTIRELAEPVIARALEDGWLACEEAAGLDLSHLREEWPVRSDDDD